MSAEPVTAAQETITCAMLAALVACFATTLLIIDILALTSIHTYLVFGLASFVISAYLVPNLAAYWLGRSLQVIMDPERYEDRRRG
jgi:hypothetical protein